jgi:DNA-binding NarL/FixJ family response regulator
LQRNAPPIDTDDTSEVIPRLRILLVDDFAPFRGTVRRILQPFPSLDLIGEAADGIAGIDMALALHPDLIVMDVQMPGLDGIESTRRIKAVLPRTYVIGVSVLDDSILREAMEAAGASAFVPKQCAISLPQVIEQVTGRRITSNEVI